MSNTESGLIIARREFTDANHPGRQIIVSLGLPKRVSSDEWQCGVRIDGLDARPISKQISGVDSLQALLLALQLLRLSLKHSPCRLARPEFGIPCPTGDIPLQVPTYLGEEFDERIEQLIKREAPRLLAIRGKIINAHILAATKAKTTSHKKAPSRGRRRPE